MAFHNGSNMIGGPTTDKDIIRRMYDLGLEINFDIYLEGNEFR